MTDKETVPGASAAGTITLGGDMTVNRLGYGTMRLPGRGVWGEPENPDEAKAVLRRAVELGIDFIDTADTYGPEVSERLISEALYPYPEGLVIATKGGMTRPGPGRWGQDGRPEHLREALEGSLRRLRVERIDLYQLHTPDPRVPYEDSLGTLAELQHEGKIRHIGISNVSAAQLADARLLAPIVSVQNRYNLSVRSSEDLVDRCERDGLAFIPYFPLSVGSRRTPASRAADAHGATPRQVAVAFLLRRSPTMLPIPGTSSVSHLEENVAAAGIELTDEEFAALAA